jgi:hypothetical protein
MHSNQSWPPVISPLGVHPCFRNATRAKQGCCRGWQGHTDFLSKVRGNGRADRLKRGSSAGKSRYNIPSYLPHQVRVGREIRRRIRGTYFW